MLARHQKISSTDFKKFFNFGKKSFSKNLRFSVIFGVDNKPSRYAVVISKKVAKSATLRNKNKRKIYKLLRQIYPQFLNINYGFLFIQNDISLLSDNELLFELQSLISKNYKK